MINRSYVRRLSFGLSFSALAVVLACGNSEDDDAGAAPGAGGPTTGSGSLQPSAGAAGSGTGAGGTAEGNPGNIPLDPTRDPSEPVNLADSGAVACGGGGDFCVAPNLTCCSGPMNAFSCAADAAQCPDGTVSTAACSSSASCADAQVCCRVGGGGGGGFGGGNNPTTTTCETSCADGAAQLCLNDAECGADNFCNNGVCAPVPCTATSCGAGELCCRGNGGGPGAAPACAAPGADGLCPDDRRQVCDDATQCPADNTCAPLFGGGGGGGMGGGGGGMGAGGGLVCTPPPCTPTSCEAGEVCCVGGGINNPTCSAASDTSECPGNSRLVCITDAECAPTAGTECLPNPNGGGGVLSCRVPPPPPAADAGVDAG
jgi:hypothetical protein